MGNKRVSRAGSVNILRVNKLKVVPLNGHQINKWASFSRWMDGRTRELKINPFVIRTRGKYYNVCAKEGNLQLLYSRDDGGDDDGDGVQCEENEGVKWLAGNGQGEEEKWDVFLNYE